MEREKRKREWETEEKKHGQREREREEEREREKKMRYAMMRTKAQGFLNGHKGPVLQVMKYCCGRCCVCGHYYFCTDFLLERKKASIFIVTPH